MNFKFVGLGLLLFLIAIADSKAQSCCCTGAGSNYAILPTLNEHVIGLRYDYTQYRNIKSSLDPELNGLRTIELVHTAQVFARFNLPKRFQLSAYIPVSLIEQQSRIESQRSLGLGDATILAQYGILNPKDCDGRSHKHQLRIGLGIKLPTGKYEKNKNNLYNTTVQLGTGSIDFIASLIYTYRYKQIVANANLGGQYNTPNRDQFKFGDKLDGGINVGYIFRARQSTIMPTVGLSYNHTFNSTHRDQEVLESSIDLVMLPITILASIGHFAIQVSAAPVLYNQVNFLAYREQIRTEIGLYYTFSNFKKLKK